MARIMSPDIGTVRVTKRTDGPPLLAECVCSFLFLFFLQKEKSGRRKLRGFRIHGGKNVRRESWNTTSSMAPCTALASIGSPVPYR